MTSLGQASAFGSRSDRLAAWIALLATTLCMWLPYGPFSGLPYETAFPLTSENQPFWHAIFYRADPLRLFTSTFYHLAFLLGEVAGIGGSFLPYQLVYVALWFGRGALAFEIVRRLFPESSALIPLGVGALTILHGSDRALNWVGQLNQFGFIFWTLSALLALVVAVEGRRALVTRSMAALAGAGFGYLTLWSYESPWPVLAVFPPCLALMRKLDIRRAALPIALFYVPPLVFAYRNLRRYHGGSGSATYQATVMRSSFEPAVLFDDLTFNVRASLDFVGWSGTRFTAIDSWESAALFAVAAIALIGAGAWIAGRHAAAPFPPAIDLVRMLIAAAVLLCASLLVYLALAAPRSLWRTQLLSSFPAAMVLVSGAALALGWLPAAVRSSLLVGFVVLVAGFGVRAGLSSQVDHRAIWDQHRAAVAGLIAALPNVRPHTVIVAVDVPYGRGRTTARRDPFGHPLWFDFALRLAYPRIPVAGYYAREDGTVPEGAGIGFDGERWRAQPGTMESIVRDVPFDHVVFVRFRHDRTVEVMSAVPPVAHVPPAVAATYDPAARVMPGPPAARAVRRYGPIPGL